MQEDRPITIKDDKGNTSKLIAEIVALFITAMDKLKLDIRSMDDLHAELKVNRNKNLTGLPLEASVGHFHLLQSNCIQLQDLAEALQSAIISL